MSGRNRADENSQTSRGSSASLYCSGCSVVGGGCGMGGGGDCQLWSRPTRHYHTLPHSVCYTLWLEVSSQSSRPLCTNAKKPRLVHKLCHKLVRHVKATLHGSWMAPSYFLRRFWSKSTGSTHFPVFFCQLWEKSFYILPAAKWLAMEALWKSILRGTCDARPRLSSTKVPSVCCVYKHCCFMSAKKQNLSGSFLMFWWNK